MEQEQSEQDDDEEEEGEDGSESEEEPEEPEQEQEDDELGREAARVVNIIPRQQILVAAVKLLREMEPTTPDASACNLQCFATAPPPREFWTDLARKAPMRRAWVGRTTYPDASSRGRKFSGALSLHTAHRIHLSPSWFGRGAQGDPGGDLRLRVREGLQVQRGCAQHSCSTEERRIRGPGAGDACASRACGQGDGRCNGLRVRSACFAVVSSERLRPTSCCAGGI